MGVLLLNAMAKGEGFGSSRHRDRLEMGNSSQSAISFSLPSLHEHTVTQSKRSLPRSSQLDGELATSDHTSPLEHEGYPTMVFAFP